MSNPRLNRLKIDYEKILELAARSQFVHVHQTEGNPPEKYVLHLICKGIREIKNDRPVFAESFYLGIHLHNDYPRKGPTFQIIAELTPVIHPNIAANGLVCIGDEGDHGWAPSMALDDVVVRIINMIRYENMGLNSAFNLVAANWAAKNQHLFPLDNRQIITESLLEINLIDEGIFITPKGGDELLDDIVIL